MEQKDNIFLSNYIIFLVIIGVQNLVLSIQFKHKNFFSGNMFYHFNFGTLDMALSAVVTHNCYSTFLFVIFFIFLSTLLSCLYLSIVMDQYHNYVTHHMCHPSFAFLRWLPYHGQCKNAKKKKILKKFKMAVTHTRGKVNMFPMGKFIKLAFS